MSDEIAAIYNSLVCWSTLNRKQAVLVKEALEKAYLAGQEQARAESVRKMIREKYDLDT